MGKRKKRDLKRMKTGSASKDTEMAATDDPGMRDEPSSTEVRKSRAKDPTEAQMTGALIAAVMDVPVDPDLDVDPEYAADLREEVAEMLDKGIMVDIPYSCDDFDPDEFRTDDEPDEPNPDPEQDSLEPLITESP
jgi:hypothetical protein